MTRFRLFTDEDIYGSVAAKLRYRRRGCPEQTEVNVEVFSDESLHVS